ncbi:MAG: acetyl-CoA decarbonylase/synthase complex subunit delta [Armatimonadota bacterium]
MSVDTIESTVTIGATPADGGTREHAVVVGGVRELAFGDGQGRPEVAIALEVWDVEPTDWPECLREAIGVPLDDPCRWADAVAHKAAPDLLCLRLAGLDVDLGGKSPEEAAGFVESFLPAVGAPLLIVGDGDMERETAAMPAVAEAAQNEACLIGSAVDRNYRTLAAAAGAFGHSLIAETPIDINLAKQLNILIRDTGFPPDRIVMHHLTSGLGYGLEYTYSIMERSRLAAIQEDAMLAMPMISFVGHENWRTKEAGAPTADMPEWGEQKTRATLWEAASAVAYALAGASIIVFRSPEAAVLFRTWLMA